MNMVVHIHGTQCKTHAFVLAWEVDWLCYNVF